MEEHWQSVAVDSWRPYVYRLHVFATADKVMSYSWLGKDCLVVCNASPILKCMHSLISFTSSTIIHHARLMRALGLVAVGYFYVDFQDRTKQGARGLLSSLLTQLCTQSGPFFDILSMLYAKHNNDGEMPSEDALAMCSGEMLKYPGQAPVFIVVDALDEAPDSPSPDYPPWVTPRQSVLGIVKGLIELKLQNLHLCLTSRPELDIQLVLDPLEPVSVRLHTQDGQLDDIARYVESVISSDIRMSRWSKNIKKLVIDTLTNKSHGM